ncbi:MAG: peptidoglycan-associated lipoprotein Pal [Pseudomonadota bacterium]
MYKKTNTRFTLVSMVLAALLAGCGSSVKLDEDKVSDAKGAPVEQTPGKPAGQPPAVTTVDSSASEAQARSGPVNVANLVYFDYDSYMVKPEFQAAIEAHAKHLNRFKSVKIVIEGHTDERGGREYNLALGQKRSEAVLKSLSLLGVAAAQVEAVSFGKEKPADTGSSETAMAKNRRAQINYR